MDQVLIDTNVLVYGYDTQDQFKYTRAIEAVDVLTTNRRGRVSTQILAELVSATTKARRPILSANEAYERVELFDRTFPVFNVTRLIVLEAVRGARQYQLSYYDAQIWATAKLNQVPTIFTEDFQNGRVVGGVRFVDPFDADFDLADWQ